MQPKIASLFEPAHRQPLILHAANALFVEYGDLHATSGISAVTSFVEILHRECRIGRCPLAVQITLPQAAATAPPAGVAGFLKKLKRAIAVLRNTHPATV